MSARNLVLRTLAPLALLGSAAGRADAQVVALFLKDEKAAKKFEDRVVMINGRQAVLGEPKVGITVDGTNISRTPNVMIELWVADPDDPSIPAYQLDRKGDVEPGSKKTILRVDGSALPDNDYATIVMRDESIPSLSREYVLRREMVDAFRAERDKLDHTTTEWAAHHTRVVTEMEGLRTWLANTLWPKYAEKYDKEIAKEAKAHKGQAVRARHDKAVASLTKPEAPSKLVELAKEHSGGTDGFHARETQHIRIYFIDSITPESVEEAIKLGEDVIEGFRTRFVDPYLGDDYEDRIPDGNFIEFLFVPDDNDKFMAYTRGLWGVDWSQNQEERLKSNGGRSDGGKRSAYRSFWKTRENQDLQGVVCHQLGHALAGLHFGPSGSIKQDWLSEAMGYYLSFEFLARNTVTCKAFDVEGSGYVKRERERKAEGEKTVGEGRRDLYNAIALELGRPIDQLARKTLFELDDADLAKSWSYFDYIARAEGKPGQLWLRAAGKHSQNDKTFLAEWRKEAATILGVGEADAFKTIEERWRKFAEAKGHKEDK